MLKYSHDYDVKLSFLQMDTQRTIGCAFGLPKLLKEDTLHFRCSPETWHRLGIDLPVNLSAHAYLRGIL